ncbi:MAG TPA: hypothetical protein VEL05_05615, partial [Candidatus Acidoferrum sp.]|nr:hypothetical protein [Candidatus Acidoferrum sp.]
LSRTRFAAARVTVWHLSLRPRAGEYFDELDIIKLIHLYDGRTEQTKLRSQIGFAMTAGADGEATMSAAEFLTAVIADCGVTRGESFPPALVAGTIQIRQPANTGFDLARSSADPALAAAADAEGPASRAIRALCGIVTGILDFDEIDGAEAADTLTPDFSRPGLFIRIHRRTIVQVSHEDRGLEAVRSMVGVSPYLVIPHAAIIGNEHQLERSQERADAAGQEDEIARSERRALNAAALRDAHAVISDSLKRLWLSNVFNYVTERTLFATGLAGRGALERYASLELELANIGTCIERIYEKRRHDAETWTAILLAAITIIQLKDVLGEVAGLVPGIPHLALALGLLGILAVGGFIYRARRGGVRAATLGRPTDRS